MKWVRAGLCVNLKSDNQERHLWVVLTEPQGEPLAVAIANLTSQKNIPDEPLIFNVGEHAFITRPTVINYAAAMVVEAERLERLIENGHASVHPKEAYCTQEFLDKIRGGVLNSPFARPRFQNYCKDKF